MANAAIVVNVAIVRAHVPVVSVPVVPVRRAPGTTRSRRRRACRVPVGAVAPAVAVTVLVVAPALAASAQPPVRVVPVVAPPLQQDQVGHVRRPG